MKKIYRSSFQIASVFLLLLIAFAAHAQKRVLTGTIADDLGSPMPGVNVVVKGTTVGTTTGGDGTFAIEATNDDILVVSFIGYTTQEIRVDNQTKIAVTLAEDVNTLQEVVVTGYGDMRRVDLSTAQTSISADEIGKTVNTSLDQALQGRTAGVFVTQNSGQPGGAISVTVRGINTITGSNEPLYVIDGVQIQQSSIQTSSTNPLSGINPADIENIEVLQGPSATALYGSRGTNGVVLITSKRGKAGETKINYSFLYSIQDKPKEIAVLSLPEYAEMFTTIRTLQGGEIPEHFSNPSLLGPGTNWQEELFKRAPMMKHNLSLSGGSEKTRYYFSGEYFNQDGVALGSSFKRYSVTLNVDNEVRKWFKLGVNLKFNSRNDNVSATENNVIQTALSIAPDIAVKNPNGSWGGADPTNGNSVQHTPLNPIAIASLTKNERMTNEFQGGVNADFNILKGLTFQNGLYVTSGSNRSEYFLPTYRIGSRVNDAAVGNSYSGVNYSWNWRQMLNYDLRLGKHVFNVMATHEAQQSQWKSVGGEKVGFATNEVQDIAIGNDNGAKAFGGRGVWSMESFLGRVVYNYNDKYLLQGAIRADGSVNFGTNNKWGYFPSVSAGWRVSQEPFMANLEAVNELKLRVEVGLTGNQGGVSWYGPLNSVATPWGTGFPLLRYSNPDLKWEETTTYNVGMNLGLLENRIQFEADFYLKQTENLLLTAPLPDYLGTAGEGSINPPQVNIGSLTNRGWAVSITAVPVSTGSLKWETNFNISGFRPEVDEFYTKTAFVDRSPWFVGDFGTGNNWTQRSQPGEAPWLFRGYIYDGIFQSEEEVDASAVPVGSNGTRLATGINSIYVGDIKFKDLNDDGIIDERDKTNIGNPWPKFTMGFSHTITYKNFALNMLFTAVYGNDVFNFMRFSNTNPNNINLGRNMYRETFQYARIEGDGADAHLTNPGTHIPRIDGNSLNGNRLRITDQFVEDGSYIRLKNISLKYTLPIQLLGSQNVVKGAYIVGGVQNAFTLTKYKGYDPEVGAYVGPNSQGDNQSQGLDIGRYPLTPTYNFTVGVEF